MNGFSKQHLDEDAFGEKRGPETLKTFDAFRTFLPQPSQILVFGFHLHVVFSTTQEANDLDIRDLQS